MAKKKNKIYAWILAGIIFIIAVSLSQKYYNVYIYKKSDANLSVVERTWLNYGEDVLEVSQSMNLPADYLLALIALESSGTSPVPSRFEPHIFNKLMALQIGKIEAFESIKSEELLHSDTAAIKNLASSWGPFQIMGYQCLHLDIKIKQLRGKNAVEHGARWIKNNYGASLDSKNYKDAFHLHNTGKKYPRLGPPRTHSRSYVPRGLKYMKEFQKIILENSRV